MTEPRYTAARQGGHLGVLDQKNHKFAPFYEAGPVPVADRVRHTVLALNLGDDTITGYYWEKADA